MKKKLDFKRAKCDKYDYMIAASCGVLAGMADAFFVGAPGQSVLQGSIDQGADGLVKKAAQTFFRFDQRTAGKPRKMPESLEQCISYLEQAFPVPYDARYAKDLNVGENTLAGMRPGNHHLLSLAHSPDAIGLIFSIIDQFTNMASFADHGQMIRVEPIKTSKAIPYLQGTNTVSRLFCGFVNWIGHLISDLVGSSSTRKPGKTNRGTGIGMPFYELFLLCDFGDIDGRTISEIAVSVFEQGYDVRFAAAMAVPVVLNDLFIRMIWALKSHFYGKKKWKDCIPNKKHDDLRVMLLVGNGTLCVVDGLDAFIRSGSNPVAFVCRLNLIAWGKLTLMALKELVIRYKYAWEDITAPFMMVRQQVEAYLAELEQIDIAAFEKETAAFHMFCENMTAVNSEEELNQLLQASMKKMGFEPSWEGDFDEFMDNKENKLSAIYSDLDSGDGTCRYLVGNLCGIYEERPLKCRVEESYYAFFSEEMTREEYDQKNAEMCRYLKKQRDRQGG